MFSINFKPITDLQDTQFGFSEKEIAEFGSLANEYYQKSAVFKEQGFVDIPYNKSIVKDIQAKTARFKDKFKNIVILGIGGSMLGVQTIVDAMYFEEKITIICLDNIDPFMMQKKTENLDLSQTIFLAQTKSGGTPETIAQYLHFEQKITEAKLKISDHFIFVTDPELGYLRKLANEDKDIIVFDIPANVGGRFSVLTPVGLLISELLEIDSQKLLDGAAYALENSKSESMKLAKIQVELNKIGVDQNVLMPYSSRLATVAKWYIQLLSESIGKEFNLAGEKVHTGITPIPALGATDQHAQMQLFKEGPNNKLLIFVTVRDHKVELPIANNIPSGFEYLKNKSFNQLLQAEFEGTQQSLSESKRPNLEIILPEVNEFNLGAMFMLLELSVAYIGELLEIDAFNQPGVERSKILAKELLEKI
jgi:glucose-6-phosphate isomerase